MQERISVLVVEDEEIWAAQLQLSLESLGFTVAAIYDTVTGAMSNIASVHFDIALLDIHIDGKNLGIELGKIIHDIYHKPFIFITGSTDWHTAQEALTAKPSAYLVKPVNHTSLFVAIQTAIDNFSQQKTAVLENQVTRYDSFFVKTGNRYKKIEWANVIALSSDGRYTKVILDSHSEEYLIGNSLSKTLDHILPGKIKDLFVQINRSETINIKHIDELNGSCIKTRQKSFCVTENYIRQLKEKLNIVT